MQTTELLLIAASKGASDLHLVPGAIPLLRVDGHLLPLADYPILQPESCVELICQVLNKDQRARLERELVLDFSLTLDQWRFRGNVFFQRSGMQVAFRLIPLRIPEPEELQLTPSLVGIAEMTRGLVLVTGATGTGKSTTLACLLNLVNESRFGSIVTIEDPIEFIYSNKKCVVSQREVGLHTPSFATALKYVLRQDPDVVMIGEMRDLETISAALTVAETGHLVMATLHSPDAPQAIDRIIDVFPARQQQQIKAQLAAVLKTVVAQTLIPRASGKGRVAAREIMNVTSGIAPLIRQGRTHEIYAAIDMGFKEGMISMGRAIAELQKKGLISSEETPPRPRGFDVSMPRRRAKYYSGPPDLA